MSLTMITNNCHSLYHFFIKAQILTDCHSMQIDGTPWPLAVKKEFNKVLSLSLFKGEIYKLKHLYGREIFKHNGRN